MPKEGYSTVTLKTSMYEELAKIYRDNATELYMKGISSFSGYVSYLIGREIAAMNGAKTK